MGAIDVEVRRLDDVLADRPGGPYAIKIDTQGFEAEGLNGAPDTLAAATLVML